MGALSCAHPEQSSTLVFVMAGDYELYRAIGEPESRNRRAQTALSIKARLMSQPEPGRRSPVAPMLARLCSKKRMVVEGPLS